MTVWPSKENLAAAGYIAGWRCVRLLPERWAYWIFERGADAASRNGKGPDQLRKNLARVVGPENVTRELVRDSMRSYMRYWCEAFRLPTLQNNPDLQAKLLAGLEGKENLDAALASGKGVILALPHTGNWDMAGSFFVHYAGGFTTVAERLKPEALYDAFVDFRTSLGFEVLPLTGGTPPFEVLAERLRSGGVVALLSERDLTRTGTPVQLCGEQANMATGSARLALETGAVILPVHLWFESIDSPTPWRMSVGAPIEATTVEETSQRLADRFSESIAEHPADWHMLQPHWNVDVEARRRQKAGE